MRVHTAAVAEQLAEANGDGRRHRLTLPQDITVLELKGRLWSVSGGPARADDLVVARQLDPLAASAQEVERRQMQRVECAYRHGKRLHGAAEHRRHQLKQGDAAD